MRLGIIPGAGGTQRLTRIAGVAAAKELILTGRRMRAQRAYALGIVSDVVPAENLADAAVELADEIAAAGPLAVAAAKRAIDSGVGVPLADGAGAGGGVLRGGAGERRSQRRAGGVRGETRPCIQRTK